MLPPGKSVRTPTILAHFPNPPLFDVTTRGDPIGISGWNLYHKQERDGATVWWNLHSPNFNRFPLIHPCDGRMDRQTDGFMIAYTCSELSMLSCAKNHEIKLTRMKLGLRTYEPSADELFTESIMSWRQFHTTFTSSSLSCLQDTRIWHQTCNALIFDLRNCLSFAGVTNTYNRNKRH